MLLLHDLSSYLQNAFQDLTVSHSQRVCKLFDMVTAYHTHINGISLSD